MNRRDLIEVSSRVLVLVVVAGTLIGASTDRGPLAIVEPAGVAGESVALAFPVLWVLMVRRSAHRSALTYWLLTVGGFLVYVGFLQGLLDDLFACETGCAALENVALPLGFAVATFGMVRRVREHKVAYRELGAKEEEFRRLSVTDSLTGLYNSKHFFDVLEAEIHRARRYGRNLALAFLDIDDFKSFNDSNGHLEGDRLLRQVARVIGSECRENDIAFRYGGEEFTILFPETDLSQAQVVAGRIRERVATTRLRLRSGGADGRTISIGVAALPDGDGSTKDFIDRADRAMYQAKLRGKNQVLAAPAGWDGGAGHTGHPGPN